MVFNVFDLMRQAQGGAAFDTMARQFGLNPDQTQRAMAALLPPLLVGLQRQAADPNAFAQLFGLAGSRQAAPPQPFSPQAYAYGNNLVGQMFGS